MNKGIYALVVIICTIGIVVMVSGCTDNSTNATANTTAEPPKYVKHTVVCPNPECKLHDPNSVCSYAGEYGRPIDMEIYETNTYGNVKYLCQICGEQWDEKS